MCHKDLNSTTCCKYYKMSETCDEIMPQRQASSYNVMSCCTDVVSHPIPLRRAMQDITWSSVFTANSSHSGLPTCGGFTDPLPPVSISWMLSMNCKKITKREREREKGGGGGEEEKVVEARVWLHMYTH